MARVLISGGSGFIGAHLVRACLERGDAVTVLARLDTDPWRLEAELGQIALSRVDFRDGAALARAVRAADPEQIFHLGATTRFRARADHSDLNEAMDENLTTLIAMLGAAAGAADGRGAALRAFVRAGSLAEYGAAPLPYREAGATAPRTAYGASMAAGTQAMLAAQGRLRFPAITARLALTYGPQQSSDFLLPLLVDHCLRRQPMTLARPYDRRDLIHVDDVVRALLLIAERPEKADPVLNVGTGGAPTMARVALRIVAKTGAASNLIRVASQTPHDADELRADISRIGACLGWAPSVSLETGIDRMIDAALAQQLTTERNLGGTAA